MEVTAGAAFDKVARHYDALWTNTGIGRTQREAVWRWVDPLFLPGDSILDLGCGTGADTLHFMSRGIDVLGLDASAEMVAMAQARGVDAHQLALENLDRLTGCYDGAISNFGVANCIRDLPALSVKLGNLIRRNGYFALCVMGPLCLWETCHFLSRARPDQAFRRWSKKRAACSMKVHVHYPRIRQIRLALKNEFELLSWTAIGLAVPPSYIAGLSAKAIQRLGQIDRHFAHQRLFRMFSDHRLLLFIRL